MRKLSLKIKLFLMELMFYTAQFWSFLTRKKGIGNPKKIVILFDNLGIGDLVMLSPIITKVSEIFKEADIFLATDIEKFIDFGRVKQIRLKEFKENKKSFDLLISPTLCLYHFPYIFSVKKWIGYFSKPKIQSNFVSKKYKYDPAQGHYLFRGIDLIKSLDEKIGEEMEIEAQEKIIAYPPFIIKEPEVFKKELEKKKYLAIAPVSKSEDRQWDLNNFAEIIRYLFDEKKIEKVVFLGDKSQWDRDFIEKLMEEIEDLGVNNLISVAGQTILSETIFLIKNSEVFMGLDSSPAHFAYQVAKRVLAIFVNVNPNWRRPLKKEAGKVICLYPDDKDYAIYSGLTPGDKEMSQILAQSITIERAKKAINKLYE